MKPVVVVLCLLGVMPLGHVSGQVLCQMPNGLVIEQKLSATCPAGALRATGANGAAAPIRGFKPAPASPITVDKRLVKRQVVRRAEFGPNWPLAVESGTLRCKWPVPQMRDVHALLIEVGAVSYTLNGIADAHASKNGWRDVREIWLNNPHIPGTKIPLSPLTARAKALCQ